jgi:SAM-dependent methyltransferase
MPFEEASFELVMFHQVLHHLDAGGGLLDADWTNLSQALLETHRVLRPGGVLLINTCSQEQVLRGAWYNALIPQAVARMARRYAPLEALVLILRELGFEVRALTVPQGEVFFGGRYLDPAGPFEKSWRSGDSVWSLASEAELEAALARLRALHEAGRAEAFVDEQDRVRRRIGQATFLEASRP